MDSPNTQKIWVRRIGCGFSSLLIGFVCAELLVQGYVDRIAKKGKLMQPDSLVGWKYLPNLDIALRNSNGQLWQIQTNHDGYRTIPSRETSAAKRILILGDSFAFGEGINQEDRFDTLLHAQEPSWSLIGWREILRDRSYLFTERYSFLEPEVYAYSIKDIQRGVALYRAILHAEAAELMKRGVMVLIAHRGEGLLSQSHHLSPEFFEQMFTDICSSPNVFCISLEQSLHSYSHDAIFLRDGHWNGNGHQVVAAILHRYLHGLN